MPSVKIEKQCNLKPDDSFKRLSDLISNDNDLRKLDPKYKTEFNPSTLQGSADGSMFKAKMAVTANGSAGSTVQIIVDLPFHLTMIKGVVADKLSRKLEEALA
ncbi:MAG: hypothetical protein AB7F86_04110 [Bdellovibrionales bacterium]